MATIETALGRLGVIDAGAAGIPLLLLHGVGSDKSVWQPQIDAFGAERRTVALDYAGYAESAPHPGASRDLYAAACWAALDTLGIERAHVCGLSLGGVVAIAMHAAAPDRCASLILADSFARHPEGQAIYDRSVAASHDPGMRGLAEARVGALVAVGASAALQAEVVETMAAIDPEAYRQGAEAVWLADQTDRVRDIRCPVLILCGSEDRITPPSLSEDLKDRIPHAALVEISGAGHLSNIEQPAIFNRVVAAFLAGVEQAD